MSGDGVQKERDPDEYDRLRRRLLWAMPTGLYLVGSMAEIDGELRRNLMTANLVVQASIEPKMVSVAVESTALTRRLVEKSGVFSVSILARSDRAVVRRFVKPVRSVEMQGTNVVTMAGEPVSATPSGLPVLAGALGWLDCVVGHRLELGSHVLFVGEVTAAQGPKGDPGPVLRMEDTRMNYGG